MSQISEKALRSQLETKRLRYVVEVARAESITTAAETLAITQSALSQNISEVEDVLGVKLFFRLPRGVKLTEAGERFVTRAKRILTEVDELFNDVHESEGLITGRLRIGITPSGFISHLRRALVNIATSYPGIAIETITGTAEDLCPRLLHGELNVVVSMVDSLQRWRDLNVVEMAPLHTAVLVRSDHPLAQLDQPTEADLVQYPCIHTHTLEPMFAHIAQMYTRNGVAFQPRYTSDDSELKRRLVLASDAFWPLVDPNPEIGAGKDYTMIKGILPYPDIALGYATSSNSPSTTMIETFHDAFEEYLKRFTEPARKVS
jgi:DNA-binding transcriptional LysR family regulator